MRNVHWNTQGRGGVWEVTGELGRHPRPAHRVPYGKGWILFVNPSSKGEWDQLLTAKK